MSKPGLFNFGFGYCARALAASVAQDGWRVAGTTREPELERESRDEAQLYSFNRDNPLADGGEVLTGFDHLLVSIAPDGAPDGAPDDDGDPVLSCHGQQIGECARNGTLRWIGYLSTTGVYGDHGGDWVDETTPVAPVAERARNRVAAEDGWRRLADETGAPVHIFRLAGIYGPGRNQIDAVRAGAAHRIHKPGQVFSRIHVDDIAGVLRASMARPRPGAIYNVCDDEAAPPDDVVAFAAELAGVPPPPRVPFADANLSPLARSFYADNKRVKNRLLKDELGYVLKYPTYREGLRALVA